MADRIAGSAWIAGEGGTQVAAQGRSRAIWHTTEGPSIEAAVSAYRSHRGWPHATWDPRDGRIVQHLHVDQSARSVENRAGGVETNRYGKVLQIETVAHAASPFTDGPLVGVDRLIDWLRSNDVPDTWPVGQPLAYGPDERRPGISPAAYGTNNGTRPVGVWVTYGGHYGHSQIPENDHGDPGRIDIDKMLGAEPVDPVPEGDLMRIVSRNDGSGYANRLLSPWGWTMEWKGDHVAYSVQRGAQPWIAAGVPFAALTPVQFDAIPKAPPLGGGGAAVPLTVSLTGTATP